MKNKILGLALVLLSGMVTGQNVEKAKEVLDALSAKTKTYKTVKASFTYTLENEADKMREVQEGTLITKGDKYYLSIGGQEIISNGEVIWTYLPDAGEVQITSVPSAEEKAADQYISPTTIFTLYEKGFKYKFIKEENVGGKTLQMINLFPIEPDEKSYHTIKLYIDKGKNQIEKIKIMGKDGTTFTYEIKSFTTNEEIADSKFTFNKSKYPDIEVIDMR